ncbi:MAG: Formamidopyrimidine-DNA glycosylase [Mycoplasmataceae bacterium]|nr:MAG: Formamidopyrimidine-DNA glycosylase [Mycoplasmataceae bacterium]
MPELPEVETVIRSLSEIKNKRIVDVEVIKENLLKGGINKSDFISQVCGERINDIVRKGKYIFILLDEWVIINHLRMTGKYFLKENYASKDQINHLSLIFHLDDGSKILFCDARNFATFHLQKIDEYKSIYPYKNIGLDLINDEVSFEYLFSFFKNKKIPIKAALLEQTIISGIGNIYASEILFLINVHPLLPTNSLSEDKIKELLIITKKILERAIELKGSSIVDFVTPSNEKGNFQNELKVYGKAGKNCFICAEKIERISIDNRSTFFCPSCQKAEIN